MRCTPSKQRCSSTSSSMNSSGSVNHDGTNRLALLHQVEAVIDLLQLEMMRDQIVDIDLAFHVPVDDLRHVRAPARAAECGAFPFAARDELKRPRADLLARRRHADDERLPPALVRAFECLTHELHVADAFE